MAILALVLVALPAMPAAAASITVNTTLDDNANNALCSLREAIIAANNNATYNGCAYVGTGPDDIITLTSGTTYTLSIVGSGQDEGDLDIGNGLGTSGDLTIQASGATNAIVDANQINRVFEDDLDDDNLTLIHITVTGGLAPDGAGIYFRGNGTLTLMNSTVIGNVATGGAACGAGIFNSSAATINIVNSTVEGNDCPSAGADGAGMYKNTGGILNITNSTFNNNTTADDGAGVLINMPSGTATITNSTFADNTAGGRGGGVQVVSGTVTIEFSTFSGNAANIVSASIGGAVQASGGSVSVVRSILANSTNNGAPTQDCDQLSPGTITSNNSLIETNSDCGGMISASSDPGLDNLADNGGPTLTMSITPASPAYNLAQSCGSVTTDQRGVARPYGTACDLGAYEFAGHVVDVSIGGSEMDSYLLAPNASTRASFPGVNNGPVKVAHNDDYPIMAAERVIYKVNGVNTSFSEMMGLPSSQLDNTYWLPWYNNVDLDTQLRIANVSGSSATVTVTIGGVAKPSFNLAVGESTRVSYSGVNSGPVEIVSTQDIVAAERVIYKVNGVNTSFTEMLALPEQQLDDTYWLPWYNNVDLDTQLRIANVSGSSATVTVTIGGVPQPSFNLAAGVSTRVSYPGVNNGPVKIVSTQDIVAAERVIYKVSGANTSFTEMMAQPEQQLDNTYWLPWYNNVDLDTQLRIANVSGSLATVTVTIGGVAQPSFNLTAGQSTRISFPSVNNGPVKIVSTQNIVAAERVIYKVNGLNTSFTELMGLPDSLLDRTFWFPWYNNVDLDTQLRFGAP